jgi:hypothetical protein
VLGLDSAHDNYDTYELLDVNNIQAFIDLNKRGGKEFVPEQQPVPPTCKAGYPMSFVEIDAKSNRYKWRCPVKAGDISNCELINCCSSSWYGTTATTPTPDDKRFYT